MQLPASYDHKQYEGDIYKLWEASGVFTPKMVGEPYTIILPPPNANARLHIGSAYDYNYKDVLARFKRAAGYDVLMLPGADHAGFETWYVYEKHLAKQGKSRFDYSREELYTQVWDFVEENKTDLLMMYKKFGLSADWSRFTYTLDQKIASFTILTTQLLAEMNTLPLPQLARKPCWEMKPLPFTLKILSLSILLVSWLSCLFLANKYQLSEMRWPTLNLVLAQLKSPRRTIITITI